MSLQGGGIKRRNDRRLGLYATGHHQRGLGQSVTGIVRLGAKTVGGEFFGELFERFCPNRLSSIEGDTPATQVESFALLGSNFFVAERVGEVGTACNRHSIFCNRTQPTDGLLQERHR